MITHQICGSAPSGRSGSCYYDAQLMGGDERVGRWWRGSGKKRGGLGRSSGARMVFCPAAVVERWATRWSALARVTKCASGRVRGRGGATRPGHHLRAVDLTRADLVCRPLDTYSVDDRAGGVGEGVAGGMFVSGDVDGDLLQRA